MATLELSPNQILCVGDENFQQAMMGALDLRSILCAPLYWDDVKSALAGEVKVVFLSGDHSDSSYVLSRIRMTPEQDCTIVLWCQAESDFCRITDAELLRLKASRLHVPLDSSDIVVALAGHEYALP